MKKTALTLTGLALALTTACGAGDDRPSRPEIAKVLTSNSSLLPQPFSEKQAKCAAKVLDQSKLSDAALKALVEKDADYKGSDKDVKVLTGLSTKLRECQ